MEKNLSEEYMYYLIDVVESVQPQNIFEKVGDFFGDLVLRVKDLFGGFNIEDYTDGTDAYHRDVLDMKNTTIEELKDIFQAAWSSDGMYGRLTDTMEREIADPLYDYIKLLNDLICTSNSATAASILLRLGYLSETLNENMKLYISPAYSSEEGKYGGYQGSAHERWVSGEADFQDGIRDIVKNYYPNASDAEITKMLLEMRNEGCNFMAMVNTLVGAYVGKEKEFEETFGFPLYDENGDVNFDYIMTDYWLSSGYYDGKEGGLNNTTSESTWENYLKGKDIKVDVVNVEVTVDNWEEMSQKGEIIIGYSPLRLRNENGDLVDTRDGGHATVITDVVEIDGEKMFKVSSWGEVYYINPDDYEGLANSRVDYQQVRY